MKKLTRISLALVMAMVLLSSGVAMAANPVVTSPTANVTVTVVAQLTISRDFHLVFPHVLVQGATRTVAAAGGGVGGSAQFTVTGAAGASVTITVPGSTTVTGPGTPAPTMTVTLTPLAGDVGTLVIPTVAPHTLLVRVGGSVTAAGTPPQAPGAYTGTFTITAVYL